MKKITKRLLGSAIAAVMTISMTCTAYADEIETIENEISNLEKDIDAINNQKKNAQDEKNAAQSQLNSVNGQISSISGAMGDLGEEIDATDQELIGLLTDINLIEADIEEKTAQIAETQLEYDAAVEEENNQYESMKIRIKFMYEQGDLSYLAIFLESANMSDALNKADYVEQLYTYDRLMLIRYQEAVAHTKEVWDQLEEEKSELETSKMELEEEQKYLEELMAQLELEYDNYSVVLAQAKQQAASYTAKINQQTNEIKKLEKAEKEKEEAVEAKKKEAQEAKERAEKEAAKQAAREALESGDLDTASRIIEETKDYDDDDDDDDDDPDNKSSGSSKKNSSSGGSGTGSAIASYGLQFVGNPYVAGGTSLTDGADCSGFVMSVYAHFGYKLPRTSYSQSTVGRSVSYSDAQPGDIIYYGGHVGIYIGNGQIVHASTERTGIKVAPATYRSIVTIRRVV